MARHMQCAAAAALAAAVFLGGCASAPEPRGPQSADAFAASMADAEAIASRKDGEAAVRAYQKIAADNPARGEPWARMAQIHFDEEHYSMAIVAAEETLKRDVANRQARSITAVGGLRLAARSLEDLRTDSALSGDATADAQRLAVLLRETLGQPVLVPAPRPASRPRPKATAVPAVADAPAARSAPAAAPVAAPASAPVRSSGNPLDAFK